MRFTDQELKELATWYPIDKRFDVDNRIKLHIDPSIEKLEATGKWKCCKDHDNGLRSYYSIEFYDPKRPTGSWWGHRDECQEFDVVCAYLSLSAPVGALGKSSISISPTMFARGTIDKEDILDPDRGKSELVDAILDAFQISPYEFLRKEELLTPLPPGIEPHEYCLCAEPWDRLFHLLFADTD